MNERRRSKARRSKVGDDGPVMPYGDPIRQAIASGDAAQMRRTLGASQAWLRRNEQQVAKVRQAMGKLEDALRDLGG